MLTHRRQAWIAEQLKIWQATALATPTDRPVDAIITPAAPYPSFRHGDEEYVFYTVSKLMPCRDDD